MPKPRILIVEDEPISAMILVENLEAEGYETTTAANGEEAWQRLVAASVRYEVVLLDRMMPDMDGIEILRRMKADRRLAQTPVIMQTALAGAADVAAGLRAGAYYYLTKPFSADTLAAIVATAVGDHRNHEELRGQVRKAARSVHCLERARFSFRTVEEARMIAALLANVAPDPESMVLGLSELMLNAVEHGNLGITYEEKTLLIGSGRLEAELERRLRLPEFAARVAVLEFERRANEAHFLIRDAGVGFDWRPYVEMSPERAFHTHGRGIALAREFSFDRVEYGGAGNEVLCTLALAGA